DWAEIRRLHRAEGMPIKAIARVLGVSRNTDRAALAADGPPKYVRPAAGSVVDPFEPRIRELLQVYPTMPATVIAERIGWTRGLTVLKERVGELRPAYLPVDPASRTSYEPGDIAQCDLWFPDVELPVGPGQVRTATQLPVLVMVSAYSRWLTARLIPSRSGEDLFAGWWQLLGQLGAVPRTLVWDGEAAIGKRRAGKTVLTEAAQGFRGVLGAQIYVCAPADPEAKGIVERANQYLETSFLPGRTFTGPADFNAQLQAWIQNVNGRRRRALGCAPTERIEVDRAAMLTLPPVAPVTGWRTSLRLPRDHYVRLDGNDYSVHPGAIGRRVEVVADLDRVRVFCDGRLVADHARSWARHQTFTEPAHAEAATVLRREHRQHQILAARALRPADLNVEQRSLNSYDLALGLIDEPEETLPATGTVGAAERYEVAW
ncbi:MAG: IS21 family transposase, partial [Catenulispora sp.]